MQIKPPLFVVASSYGLNFSMNDPDLSAFSDVSFDPVTRSGVAGFFMIESNGEQAALAAPPPVTMTVFRETNCTRLELESVLLVLREFQKTHPGKSVRIYTDSKSVIELPARRQRLAATDFISGATGKLLKNADLYRSFFALTDQIDADFLWIKGHKSAEKRAVADQLFSLVDKATRKALRSGL